VNSPYFKLPPQKEISKMYLLVPAKLVNEPWNKRKLVGQKCPLKRKDIWALRVRLEMTPIHDRDLAMFNLAIDSKLRASDLVKLRVKDASIGGKLLKRTMIIQQKTSLPVQFELTEPTRDVLDEYIHALNLRFNDYLLETGSKAYKHLYPL
jgi:integrase